MEDLRKKAQELAGRPVEIEKLSDGNYIVLWMAFERSPPPKASSEEEALKGFIDMMLRRQREPDTISTETRDSEGGSDGSNTGDTAQTSAQDQSP